MHIQANPVLLGFSPRKTGWLAMFVAYFHHTKVVQLAVLVIGASYRGEKPSGAQGFSPRFFMHDIYLQFAVHSVNRRYE